MWEDNCPRKIGFHNFLTKYSNLFPERVEHYAKDHWKLTQDLLDHGQKIASKTFTNPNMFLLFLFKVCMWKNPHEKELQKAIGNVMKNSIRDVEKTFEEALEIYLHDIKDKVVVSESADRRLTDTFGKLYGFGKGTGSRKMVSAILRFLDPTKYGTVDYRNWTILSNTRYQFLDEPLLNPLANTLEETKHKEIDTDRYIQYLKIIRNLARENRLKPSEVDMALFAYSDEVIPLSRESPLSLAMSKEKALKMMKIVQEVAESARKVGYPRSATILLNAIKPLVERGDYQGIYKKCKDITSRRPDKDENIERRGGKSLKSQLPRLKEIYDSD